MITKRKFFHWLPRILCIIAILFVSMFALDAFGQGKPLWDQIQDFLMHLIPTYVLIVFLFVAWKWELLGGIIFVAAGIGFTPWVASHNYDMNDSIWMTVGVVASITFPFVVIGVLFITSHFLKKRTKKLGH